MCIRTVWIKRSLFVLKQMVLLRVLTTKLQPECSFSHTINIHDYKTKITFRLSLMLHEGSFLSNHFPRAKLNLHTI
jgi:hypothetical protein